METANISRGLIPEAQAVRDEWLDRLARLVDDVERWAKQRDWSTRRIEKSMDDSQLGRYKAPALLLQREFTRLILEPVTRFAVSTDGRVDLYVMPAYDDLATFYLNDGQWWAQHTSPLSSHEEPVLLTEAAFDAITEAMRRHDGELS